MPQLHREILATLYPLPQSKQRALDAYLLRRATAIPLADRHFITQVNNGAAK
jgi:hypothetical protein